MDDFKIPGSVVSRKTFGIKNSFGSINFKKQQQQWHRESDGMGEGNEEEKVLPGMHDSKANHSTLYCIMITKKQFPAHTYSTVPKCTSFPFIDSMCACEREREGGG